MLHRKSSILIMSNIQPNVSCIKSYIIFLLLVIYYFSVHFATATVAHTATTACASIES